MIPIIGIVIVLGCVFGGYVLAGGKLDIIIHALPFELLIIGGAASGALVVSNKMTVIKALGKTFKKSLSGPYWQREDYVDLLCLMYALCKVMKSKGFIAVEQHIESPHESEIFSRYERILHDHLAIDLICDTLRSITMGMEDPHQLEDMIEKKLESHHHEVSEPAHALQTMAEGLPAIGIVAAVLGVIKTMASINQPPEVLGKMIGGALVGTFLGVFLSYCIVGPFATKAQQTLDEEHHFYLIIRDILISHMNGMPPPISVEVGRGNVPGHCQPTFAELEERLNEVQI